MLRHEVSVLGRQVRRPATVVGGSGGVRGADPMAVPGWPHASNRHPRHGVAVAPGPGGPALDPPSTPPHRRPLHGIRAAPIGAATGLGELDLGVPADPGRTCRARLPACAQYGVVDPEASRQRGEPVSPLSHQAHQTPRAAPPHPAQARLRVVGAPPTRAEPTHVMISLKTQTHAAEAPVSAGEPPSAQADQAYPSSHPSMPTHQHPRDTKTRSPTHQRSNHPQPRKTNKKKKPYTRLTTRSYGGVRCRPT